MVIHQGDSFWIALEDPSSVVNVSQIFTIDKTQLEEKIGTLSARRVREILSGLRLLTEPREPE